MRSYSGEKFYRDWRYAVAKDFNSSDGEPVEWAPGNPQIWGSEFAKIPLEGTPHSVAANSDNSLVAVAVGQVIHIYRTDTFEERQVLKGHVSTVDIVAFHPIDPLYLVSAATNNWAGSKPADPEVIIWSLDEQLFRPQLHSDLIEKLGQKATSAVGEELKRANSHFSLSQEENDKVAERIGKLITEFDIRHNVSENPHLPGRFLTSFQTRTFNKDGSKMFYLPGTRPASNGDVPWPIRVWDTVNKKDLFEMTGHRDAIMWAGFSPDEKKIGTVCWDKTIRIWSATDGKLLHTFKTDGQNWTGDFSPDSRFFAGTVGSGNFFVWNLEDVTEIASYKFGDWCRALDWSPDGKYLAVGGRKLGRLVVFDLEKKDLVQERLLSTERMPEAVQRIAEGFLEASEVKFLDGGRLLIYRTSGDRAVEVYSFAQNLKWRFAPPEGEGRGDGFDMAVLAKKGLVASMDGTAIRFWKIPLSNDGR